MVQTRKFNRHVRNLIADFRGLPRETSHSVLRKTVTVGKAVDILLKKIFAENFRPERALQEHWDEIVGPIFATRCSPVKILANGILVVRSDSAVIRSELQMQKHDILCKIEKYARCANVADIRFIANN